MLGVELPGLGFLSFACALAAIIVGAPNVEPTMETRLDGVGGTAAEPPLAPAGDPSARIGDPP